MGVLVIYTLSNIDLDDIRLVGEALDAMPHGRVQKFVAKIQRQIDEQEAAERARIMDQREADAEAWKSTERQKLMDELTAKTNQKDE